MFQTRRFRFVEVVCDNVGATQFHFDTDATLQEAQHILAVEAFSVSEVTKSPTTGRTVVADAILQKSYLTLVAKSNDEETIYKLPLAALVAADNSGRLRLFNIPRINVTKCYITVADTTSLVNNTIWLLGFHYVSPADVKKV